MNSLLGERANDNDLLAEKIVGKSANVNSYHHQAVKAIPEGWRVSAVSPDGIIESIEYPGQPIFSVQWHPEVLGDENSARLFTAFVNSK